ncbi:hypothetical protein [Corynebacterium gerontici]|uniref:hypothetical protein n=1 Tax=Corynebacterium gerontici TaxID=2079234 RepID=UPI0019D17F7F|nr:hypothetical protein [Corynebacterium gerontici]
MSDLQALLARDGGQPEASNEHASMSLIAAEGIVDAYCRGRHKTMSGRYRPGVESVILLVAARIHGNPSQVAINLTVGQMGQSLGKGFNGLTLGEQQILNRYRKTATG